MFTPVVEPYVDSEKGAEFLGIACKTLLLWARKGIIPGYPLGQGVRKTWRFRISELETGLRDVTKAQKCLSCSNRLQLRSQDSDTTLWRAGTGMSFHLRHQEMMLIGLHEKAKCSRLA